MIIRLIAVGTRMPAWVEAGYQEYAKRLTQAVKLQLIEIPAGKRSPHADFSRIRQIEGSGLLAACPPQQPIVALEVGGVSLNTDQLTDQLKRWMQETAGVSLLVGGPDGLSPEALKRADWRWSLSALTLPHPLIRILVAEQIYRAFSQTQNHPYHR